MNNTMYGNIINFFISFRLETDNCTTWLLYLNTGQITRNNSNILLIKQRINLTYSL